MSNAISEARTKRSVTATAVSPPCAEREHLALLGRDVDLLGRLAPGAVGGREQSRGGVLAQRRRSPLAARTSPPAPRIAPPRRSGDISAR